MKAAIYSQKSDLDTFLYLSKFVSELEKRGVQAVLYEEMANAMQFSKIFETFAGKEDLKTKFGTVPSMIFRPLVQSGRVFKEEESLTVWISDDENKLPLRIKASLAVGSLKADIDGFKGLKNPFVVKVKK